VTVIRYSELSHLSTAYNKLCVQLSTLILTLISLLENRTSFIMQKLMQLHVALQHNSLVVEHDVRSPDVVRGHMEHFHPPIFFGLPAQLVVVP